MEKFCSSFEEYDYKTNLSAFNINQDTTTFNADSLDTNNIFGETLQTETQIPENFGQTYQDTTTTTTTTNVIEGNNYFDTINQIQVQDPNTFITEGNIDTNALFTTGQTIQPETTTTTNAETTAFFGQTQDINMNPTIGETQIIQGTEANTFFDANPNDFGQIQTQNIVGQDIYGTYQATKTDDLNSFGYGTTETQPIINTQPQPEIVNPPPEPYFPPIPNEITQTQTVTTTTKTVKEPNYGMQFTNQNLGPLDYEAYPATSAPTVKTTPEPKFDIAQFQQTLEATPLTTSTTIEQFSPQPQEPITIQQAVPTPAPKIIATPQPIVQATYTPPPKQITIPAPKPVAQPVKQIRNVKRTVPRPVSTPITTTYTTATPTPITIAPQPQIVQQTYQVQTANPPVPVIPQQQIIPQTYQTQNVTPVVTQPGMIPGYQYINKLIDEDFRRGRPIYNEPGVTANKLRTQKVNQLNPANTPTYKVGNIVGLNRNKIGLSKLGHSNSYSNFGVNTPTLKNMIPNVNTPNINLPNVNTPNINVPNITTPNINLPNITTPKIDLPKLNAPNINIPSINTPNINTNLGNVLNDNVRDIGTNITTPNLTTNIGNTLNNNIQNINTNIGNNINNAIGNVNSGLDKIGKASSYNVGANSITPLLNNVGLNINNGTTTDNNKLPQLKDFL